MARDGLCCGFMFQKGTSIEVILLSSKWLFQFPVGIPFSSSKFIVQGITIFRWTRIVKFGNNAHR